MLLQSRARAGGCPALLAHGAQCTNNGTWLGERVAGRLTAQRIDNSQASFYLQSLVSPCLNPKAMVLAASDATIALSSLPPARPPAAERPDPTLAAAGEARRKVPTALLGRAAGLHQCTGKQSRVLSSPQHGGADPVAV